jgi:hypothetical protein
MRLIGSLLEKALRRVCERGVAIFDVRFRPYKAHSRIN